MEAMEYISMCLLGFRNLEGNVSDHTVQMHHARLCNQIFRSSRKYFIQASCVSCLLLETQSIGMCQKGFGHDSKEEQVSAFVSYTRKPNNIFFTDPFESHVNEIAFPNCFALVLVCLHTLLSFISLSVLQITQAMQNFQEAHLNILNQVHKESTFLFGGFVIFRALLLNCLTTTYKIKRLIQLS